MANLAVRVNDVLAEAIDRQAGERSAAARALMLVGLAATGEDMRTLLPEIVAAQRARGLSPGLRQALDDLYQQTTGTAPRATPPAESPPEPPASEAAPPDAHQGNDMETGGFRC
jgi:hypothetical protein